MLFAFTDQTFIAIVLVLAIGAAIAWWVTAEDPHRTAYGEVSFADVLTRARAVKDNRRRISPWLEGVTATAAAGTPGPELNKFVNAEVTPRLDKLVTDVADLARYVGGVEQGRAARGVSAADELARLNDSITDLKNQIAELKNIAAPPASSTDKFDTTELQTKVTVVTAAVRLLGEKIDDLIARLGTQAAALTIPAFAEPIERLDFSPSPDSPRESGTLPPDPALT